MVVSPLAGGMTRVKISTTEELLAVLPHHVGHRLDHCLAILMVTDRIVGPVARFDLPPERHARRAADELLASLRRIDPQQAMLVGFESLAGESRTLMHRVHRELVRDGVGIIVHVVVRDGRWWGWCCRPPNQLLGILPDHRDGHPLPDDASVPAVAAFIAQGSSPLASRAEVSALVAEDASVSLGVGDALQVLWDAVFAEVDPEGLLFGDDEAEGDVADGWADVQEDDERESDERESDEPEDNLLEDLRSRASRWVASVDRAAPLWAKVLTPVGDRGDTFTVTDGEVARMVHSLANKTWRDALIAWMSPVMFPLESVDPEAASLLQRHVTSGPATDAAHSTSILHRLQGLARRVPDAWAGETAAICTVTGCVAWGVGSGSTAGDAVNRALAVNPEYTLALYLGQMIEHQLRPRHQWKAAAA